MTGVKALDFAGDVTVLDAMIQDVMERIAKSRAAEESERGFYEPWDGIFSNDRCKQPRSASVFAVKTPGSA
jgi:hypothetical protein